MRKSILRELRSCRCSRTNSSGADACRTQTAKRGATDFATAECDPTSGPAECAEAECTKTDRTEHTQTECTNSGCAEHTTTKCPDELAGQNTPTPQSSDDIETVQVTGVRASLQGALTVKQDATQLMDVIVAEDIGKLPDTTVVNSLQHLTGISILRNTVEPTTVLIRGLPDVATLLNGREMFTSTGRILSLADLPSELLAEVDVQRHRRLRISKAAWQD